MYYSYIAQERFCSLKLSIASLIISKLYWKTMFLRRLSAKKKKKIVMSWAHIRCNKPIPGTNTETNQTQPAWTLNKGGGTFSIHVGWHFLVLLSLLLICLSDQTAITRSRFISETIQYRPKACWRRSTILYKVCHVNSVDWSTQQLVERTSHTYSSLVRERWCL